MYLSFNNIKNIIFYFLGGLFLIFLQVYIPQISISSSLSINFDILLIYLTCLVLIFKLHQIIYFAFIIGLLQDLVINIDMIGILSMIKLLSVYFIGFINKYKFVWNNKIKLGYLFIIYFFHFMIYYYILIDNNNYLIFVLSILQAISCLTIFLLIQRTFLKNRFFI